MKLGWWLGLCGLLGPIVLYLPDLFLLGLRVPYDLAGIVWLALHGTLLGLVGWAGHRRVSNPSQKVLAALLGVLTVLASEVLSFVVICVLTGAFREF
jgi:hypothetical protein